MKCRFRWAALQLERVKRLPLLTPRAIFKALQSLPKDLDETYERILTKIPDINSEAALSAIRWISFATRPLFVEELVEVCAIHFDADAEFDPIERFDPRSILDLLPGLVSIDPPIEEEDDVLPGVHTVTFAHFSVQEYFLGDRIASSEARFYHLDVQYSNHFIARSCLSYLFCCNTHDLRRDNYPLRLYAWDFWAFHAAFDIKKSIQELHEDAANLFQSIACREGPDDHPVFHIATIMKYNQGVGRDAGSLSNSITHQEGSKTKKAFQELMDMLSYIAPWSSFRQRRCLIDSVRAPFFYDEFCEGRGNEPNGGERGSDPPLRFKYDALHSGQPSIRLLQLFPSTHRFTEVRARLYQVSLDDYPKYDGVSYFWGDPQERSYIRCNGLLLQVSRGLAFDLKTLRPKDGASRIFFVDSICFNNEDRQEERTKAMITPRVFKQAQQVAIGLGDSLPTDASAIDFAQKVGSISLVPKEDSLVRNSKSALQLLHHESDIGLHILKLFQRDWWLRAWPVKELVLSQRATLYFGDLAVTFDTIQRVLASKDILRKLLSPTSYSRLVSDKSWIAATRVSALRDEYVLGLYPTLPELLWATQFHHSRHRAAKIYALVGILDPEEQRDEMLIEDAALSMEENFTRVTFYLLKKHQDLDILSYASSRHWKSQKVKNVVPSWVPDYGMWNAEEEGQSAPLVLGIFGPPNFEDLYHASKKADVVPFTFSVENSWLLIQGFRLDAVDSIEGFSVKDLQRLCELTNQEKQLKLPKEQSVLEALWRTIHVDQWEGERIGARNEIIDVLRSCEKNNQAFPKNLEVPWDFQWCTGRQLFVSTKGYWCLGPEEAIIGDIITILRGAKVPYMLRSSGKDFRFLGEWLV